MNRIIRFRAWDKTKGFMYHDSNLGQFFSAYDEHDDWELMQFTGLLDKNGKEIYEGDIVIVHFIGGNRKSERVYWNEEKSCLNKERYEKEMFKV